MHQLKLLLGAALVALGVIASAAAAPPNDPHYGPYQWGPKQIRAEQAWTTSRGAGQVIAIVDSGIDLSHPDLVRQDRRRRHLHRLRRDGPVRQRRLAVRRSGRPAREPHGTHVAGIAAATTGNGIGIAGVAPDARLLAVKVLTADGGTFEEIAAGIRWATDNGADVINMSLGALPGVQALAITGLIADTREAVAYAVSRGVVVIAAAGNDFASICGEPAFDPNVLCVVATDRNELRASYSNFGVSQAPDNVVAAPGGAGLVACEDDIVSTVPASAGGFVHHGARHAGLRRLCRHVDGDAARRGRRCAPDRSGPLARRRDPDPEADRADARARARVGRTRPRSATGSWTRRQRSPLRNDA